MIQELVKYDVPYDKIEEAMVEWASEALDLRHGAVEDPDGKLEPLGPSASVADMLQLLYRIQVRTNRVDELLLKAIQAKGRAKRVQEKSEFDAQRAYDEAMRSNAERRTRMIDDFSSARERHSDASLDSFENKRIAHHAGRTVSLASEVYDLINQVHWQLESMRKDVRTSIHALQFELSLGT